MPAFPVQWPNDYLSTDNKAAKRPELLGQLCTLQQSHRIKGSKDSAADLASWINSILMSFTDQAPNLPKIDEVALQNWWEIM